jgi:hypothetical protein
VKVAPYQRARKDDDRMTEHESARKALEPLAKRAIALK